jgi:hypothetical protein
MQLSGDFVRAMFSKRQLFFLIGKTAVRQLGTYCGKLL